MPYEEFAEYLADVIGQYNNTVHSGDVMSGMTPCEAFTACIDRPIRIADPVPLSMYFKRTSRLLTVGRNGIRIPELQQHYDAEELFPYQDKKVYARYNTDDIRQVYCISEDGEFICMAKSVALGSLNEELTAQNMRRINAQKKQRRKQAREYIPDIAIPSVQQLAIESGLSFDKPDLRALPTMQTVNSTQQKKARKIQRAEHQAAQMPADGGKTRQEREDAYYDFVTGGLENVSGGGNLHQ